MEKNVRTHLALYERSSIQRINQPVNPASLTLVVEFHDSVQPFFGTMTVAAHFDQTKTQK